MLTEYILNHDIRHRLLGVYVLYLTMFFYLFDHTSGHVYMLVTDVDNAHSYR